MGEKEGKKIKNKEGRLLASAQATNFGDCISFYFNLAIFCSLQTLHL